MFCVGNTEIILDDLNIAKLGAGIGDKSGDG
jgi:hypothetical protein